MQTNAFTVTTGLLVAFALFVIFTRFKNWLDSNVPIIFYISLAVYSRSLGADDSKVPLWLMLGGVICALMLRFEFMNAFFTKAVKFVEICALAGIAYFLMMTLLT